MPCSNRGVCVSRETGVTSCPAPGCLHPAQHTLLTCHVPRLRRPLVMGMVRPAPNMELLQCAALTQQRQRAARRQTTAGCTPAVLSESQLLQHTRAVRPTWHVVWPLICVYPGRSSALQQQQHHPTQPFNASSRGTHCHRAWLVPAGCGSSHSLPAPLALLC
jgi:hypothetical protein